MKVIIAGGGTGGHVFPAIAIANALKAIVPNVEILFVGAKGKLEMEKVPQAGYKIIGLWISGFQRKLTTKNLSFPFKLVHSLIKSKQIIKSFQPDVVVGVGGYASGPMMKAAAQNGIPTVIQEQNSYAGVTNKLLAKSANAICVAYEGMETFFPKNKIVLTGNPVRAEINDSLQFKQEAYKYFNLDPSKKTISVLGGSLGALTLNEACKLASELIKSDNSVQIIWQCGKAHFINYESCELAQSPNVKIFPFIEKMDFVYAISDLIVARAGALTVSELCIAGKAVILVPSPNVAEDHQTKNALSLLTKNAALIIKDSDARNDLFPAALKLVHQEDRLRSMSIQISLLARPDAARDIANIIIETANKA